VHEHIQNLDNVESLDGELLHYPYRDLSHHVMKVAKYSRWAADDLRARGRRTTPLDVLVRPFWRFVRDYVVFSGGATGGRVSSYPWSAPSLCSASTRRCSYRANKRRFEAGSGSKGQ
jgi:hypothetical protein